MKAVTRISLGFVFVSSLAVACSSTPSEEDSASTSAAQTASCATSTPDGAGGVWYNFRAEDIQCPNDILVNSLLRTPGFYDGHLMQGRIRCGYEWLRRNKPDVFQSLGQVSSNETQYTSAAGLDAWYNQFSTGSKVQFEWNGPCAGSGNGFLKFYVVPCNFVVSTFDGGALFESAGCGTSLRQTVVDNGQMRIEANVNGLKGTVLVSSNGRTTLEEGDFRAVQIATSQLSRSRQYSRIQNKPGANVDPNCAVAAGYAIVSGATTFAACIVPEPFEPIACAASIGGALVATSGFAVACR